MPETILIFLFGDLGDTILTLPALRALRRRYPGSRLVITAKASTAAYVRDLALMDDVIVIDKHLFDRLRSFLNPTVILRSLRAVGRIRRERADVVVLFQHLSTRWGALKFAGLALSSGAKRRVGLDNGRGWFLTDRVPDRGFGAVHESHYWLEVAGVLDARGASENRLPVSEAEREYALQLLDSAEVGNDVLAIHPGVGGYGPGRQWGARNFARAARLILDRRQLDIVLVGSDTDTAAAEELLAHLGSSATNLVGRTSTPQLAALLERCTVLLSNDGGVAHLAAAVGTPTVTVFGPSNEAAWRPLGGTVVSHDLPCRPCFYRDFEIGLRHGCATRECLSQVSPSRVANEVIGHLEPSAIGV